MPLEALRSIKVKDNTLVYLLLQKLHNILRIGYWSIHLEGPPFRSVLSAEVLLKAPLSNYPGEIF